MSTPVRRATRRHRCARCGYTRTYENAGATEARYWFSRHSCTKQEQRMVAEHLADIREQAIDRTPKPCLHKIANQQHGTNACYVLDGCRCLPCANARWKTDDERRRLQAYGRYHKYVDAHPVRLHVRELMDYGIGLKRIVQVSGVPQGVLWKLMYGKTRPDGTRTPSRRVLRTTAEALYDVEPIPANLADAGFDHERTPAARLHLRALVALGWSQSKIAGRLGINPANFTAVIAGDRTLIRSTVDRIEALYAELCMTLPPEADHRDKIAASRARSHAQARGWLPPLALEDVDAEGDELQDFDDVAIERRMAGDRTVRLTKAEKVELVRRWQASGGSLNELERLTGFNVRRYLTRDGEAA